MCLGAEAKAANEAATKQYVTSVSRRERMYKGQLDIFKTKGVQYKQELYAINRGADLSYQRNQTARYRGRQIALRENQKSLIEFMSKSSAAKQAARGVTGRSTGRLGVVEMGALGRSYAARAAKLTDLYADTSAGSQRVFEAAKNRFRHASAKVALAPTPGIAPPKPVYRSPAQEGFMQALQIGMSLASLNKGS